MCLKLMRILNSTIKEENSALKLSKTCICPRLQEKPLTRDNTHLRPRTHLHFSKRGRSYDVDFTHNGGKIPQ